MALTLDATVGGSNSNSYISLAEAESYFESKVSKPGWDAAANDAAKEVALVEATRWLDANYCWYAWPVSTTQALQWPRNSLLDRNQISLIPQDEIPKELKWATCEMANALLVGDRSADSDVETQGVTRIKAGSVELEFKDTVYAKPVPDVVVNLLPRWWGYLCLTAGGGMRSVDIWRG